MKIVKGWAGFGATMFDVVVSRLYCHYFLIFLVVIRNSFPLLAFLSKAEILSKYFLIIPMVSGYFQGFSQSA